MTTKSGKSRSRNSSNSKTSDEPFSKPALKLIDQVATLLKKGIIEGEKKGLATRAELKKNALSFIEKATDKLETSVHETSSLVKKGIKKL